MPRDTILDPLLRIWPCAVWKRGAFMESFFRCLGLGSPVLHLAGFRAMPASEQSASCIIKSGWLTRPLG